MRTALLRLAVFLGSMTALLILSALGVAAHYDPRHPYAD